MITENDLKALRRHETRMGTIAYWTLILSPVLLVVVGCLNLWIASRIGSIGGYNLGYLFKSWIESIDVDQQYSGLYLKAMEQLKTALLQFYFALMLSILSYGYHLRRKMDIRILETLEQSGVLKKSD